MQNLLHNINCLLEQNQNILAEHSQLKDSMKKMLSNISHDLKTPLTVVIGYIETITYDNKYTNSEKKQFLKKVYDKTIEVLQLIDEFFQLSKIESGDQIFSLAKVNITKVTRKTLLDYYDVLSVKNMEVVIDIPEYPLFSLSNEEALKRILNNLIENAIYHGSDGKLIGLSLRNDNKYIYLDVWDKGKGILEQSKNRVFDRLYTLDDSRNRVNKRSGLGLTITKKLVETLGGQISLTSTPYEKTVFTIQLPQMTF
jgi:signal transduction histidine kinase